MLCGQRTLIQTLPTKARAFSLRCKRWSCNYCKPWRRKRLVWLARSGQPTLFLTLTSKPVENEYPVERAQRMVIGWRELHRRIKRTWRYDRLDYLVVLEATQRGEPHLHILLRGNYIPQKWISEQWQQITGAFVVDIRRADGDMAVSAYIAKYVGKEPHHFGSMKRYWRSQKWDTRPKRQTNKEEWRSATNEERNHTLVFVIAIWAAEGRIITASSNDFVESKTGPPLSEP